MLSFLEDLPPFIQDREYASLDTSVPEMERLHRLTDNVKSLHQLTTQVWENSLQQVESLFEAGCLIFGLETGIVSKIEGDDYTVVSVRSPIEALKAGDVFELKGTYCYDVFRTQKIIGYPHIGTMARLKDHPVYVNLKLEAYLNAPIYVDGRLHGTINFTSTTPRKHGFSEHERYLIMLIADSISKQLVLEKRERGLMEINSRMKQLVGYVAHDLRNPLAGLECVVSFLKESGESHFEAETYLPIFEDIADTGMNLVTTILEMAALGSGKIELEVERCSMRSLVDKAIHTLGILREHRDLELDLQIDESLVVDVDAKHIQQVLTNLLQNAFKYSPEKSIITITVELQGEDAQFKLSIAVDSSDTEQWEKSYLRSTGFGLEIIREILLLHHSKLENQLEGQTYTTHFSLPLASALA